MTALTAAPLASAPMAYQPAKATPPAPGSQAPAPPDLGPQHATSPYDAEVGERHTLSVLVENKPGVLARIASLFSRRAFNIDSLTVGETENAEISRITIVVNCEDRPLEQVTKQLNKLINVIKIVQLEPTASVRRQLLLVKVRAEGATRSQVLDAVQLFRAKVVDVAPDGLTIEATGSAEKLTAFCRLLEPFGIRELVQSGVVAIGRGSRSIAAPAPLEGRYP